MIREETQKDQTLQVVMSALENGCWHIHKDNPEIDKDTFTSLQHVKSELTASKDRDILLRGARIVIPRNPQKLAVDIAHEGHQGLVKTKSLVCEKVWFPGIDARVEQTVKSCLACQLSTSQSSREPLNMSPLPSAP